MRLATRRQWEVFAGALRFAALLGASFGGAVGAAVLKPPLLGAALGACSGLLDATALMALIGGAEIFVPRTRLGRRLAQLPFLAVLVIKFAVYTAVIVAVIGGQLGLRTVMLAVDEPTAAAYREQVQASLPRGLLGAVAAITTFLLLLLRQAAQIVGERTGRDIALGRYHRPRTEERFFLFIDIVGSTPVAERLGAPAVHRYLNRIFQEASDPIDDHGGEVYQYVGDEIVVTWRVPDGRAAARPLACLFAVEAALARAAPEFEREFGTVPRLRAALHAGEVVAGESGGSRRAIVFHGDVMNTTSRVENLTRELGQPFLVSEDALVRLEGTDAYALKDMGPQPLRGRQASLHVYAVALRARGGEDLASPILGAGL